MQFDELHELSEEEFGGGSELNATGFLIFGLLTFWIYTVWRFSACLQRHFKLRWSFFNSLLQENHIEIEDIPDPIIEKGFFPKGNPKYICTLFFSISMLIIGGRTIFIFFGVFISLQDDLLRKIDLYSTGIASFFFCISSIYFIWWVCTAVKNHEYYEMLLAKFVKDHLHFRLVPPSPKFSARWNQNQNRIALFLILCIPLTVSPFISVHFFYRFIDSNAGLVSTPALIIWQILLFTCAAIFHIWGTQLLLNMHNGHLRIEKFNQPIFASMPSSSRNTKDSVIFDSSNRDQLNIGDLVPKRTLAAIMITDMVGFSKEMETDEENVYTKLLKHNHIIREIIKENNGYEIKTIGDAFLVRFWSAVDAVKAGIQIQSILSNYNHDKHPREKIVVRIGIHIGDILIMDRDIIGNGVNIASRIEPLAEPGGICISADVYNIIKKSIDVKVINIGKKELKNIRDAPELYKILIESATPLDSELEQ